VNHFEIDTYRGQMPFLEHFPEELHPLIIELEQEILTLWQLEEARDLRDLKEKLLPLCKLLNRLFYAYVPDCANDKEIVD